jgi:tetratricopeptide (TPR) repeat protein
MFRLKLIAFAVSTLCVAGCASLAPRQANVPLKMQPAFGVQHGGVTAEAMVRIGRYFQGQRRYEEAIAAYHEALAQDPALADARNGLGVIYAIQGRLDAAIVQFRAAIAQAPDAAHLRNNLGYALLLRGDDGAATVFEDALRLDPDNERAQQNLRLAQAAAASLSASLPVAPPRPASAAPDAPDAPQLTIVTPNAVLDAIAPGIYELRSAASASAEQAVPPRLEAAPQRTPYKLEVSNGNGVDSMARRVADFLARHHIAAGRLTNAPTFREPTTYIEYRPGYRAEALALGELLPRAVRAAESITLRNDVHVRVVIGHDARSELAYFDPSQPQPEPVAVAGAARKTP